MPWYTVGYLFYCFISRCQRISANQRFQLLGYHHFVGWQESIMILRLALFSCIVYARMYIPTRYILIIDQ